VAEHDPAEQPEREHDITLTVRIQARGDYYFDADDLAANARQWIDAALEDRDDIHTVTITEAEPVPVLGPPACGETVTAHGVDYQCPLPIRHHGACTPPVTITAHTMPEEAGR